MRLLLLLACSALALGPFAVRPAAFSFEKGTGLSNRFITPNGDGKNDAVVFTYSNPRASAVTGRVLDLRGRKVADLAPGPVADSLTWAPGGATASGVYIYVLEAEGTASAGTLVVLR